MLRLHLYNDPILRKKAENIRDIDDTIYNLAQEMAQLMYRYNGIGLSANQVGILKRIIVVDLTGSQNPKVFINPQILTRESQSFFEEGCLSFPGVRAVIPRSAYIRVKALDLSKGDEVEFDCDGLFGRVLQHEIDHLDGKLFIDYLSKQERRAIVRCFGGASKSSQR